MSLKTIVVVLGTVAAAIAVLASRAEAAEVEGEIKIKDFRLEAV